MMKTLCIVILTAAAMIFGYNAEVNFTIPKVKVRVQKAPKTFELQVKDAPGFFERKRDKNV